MANGLTDRVAQGTLGVLSMGFCGYKFEDFRRLALGWLTQVEYIGVRRARLVFWDFLGLLNADRPHAALNFGRRSEVCSLDSDYTVGDTTINVTSLGLAIGELSGGGGQYLLRMQPASGDPFLLWASGDTATSFTGVSPAGKYGTTAVDIAAGGGGEIEVWYRVEGHPCELAAQVLTSTGSSGANGSYDERPEAVGYGVPEDLVDTADLAVWQAFTDPASGAIALDIPVWNAETEGDNYPTVLREGFRDLLVLLGQLGIWAVIRQGQVTLRCLRDLTGLTSSSDGVASDFAITSADLVGRPSVELFHMEQQEESTNFRVTAADGGFDTYTGAAGPKFRPAGGTREQVLEHVRDNGTAVCESVAARVGPWRTTVLEVYKITLNGLKWMALCVGDLVPVTFGPFGGDDAYYPAVGRTVQTVVPDAAEVIMMVSAIQFMPGSPPTPTVYLELAYCPPEDEELPCYAV